MSFMSALLATGFLSILVQALLLRELAVASYGIELIYTLALACWLFWSALGALLPRKQNSIPSRNQVGVLFALMAVALIPGLAFIRAIRPLFAPAPGAYLPLSLQLLSMSASLFPFGILSGLQFQWAAKRYMARGRSLALAYAWESAGGLAGGLCSAWVISGAVNSVSAILVCSVLALLCALWFNSRRSFRFLTAAITALFISSFWFASNLDIRMTRWTHPNLLESRDSPYGRITITRLARQTAVFENDALLFTSEETAPEEVVHLAALQHPAPQSILILGGGIEGMAGEALKHNPAQVDCVELNPVLVSMAASYLPETRDFLQGPEVRVVEEDPRRYLLRAPAYDLILSGMPEPSSGQANRFYTVEFFRLCAAHMSPGGILGFRLPSSENVWTPQLALRNASISAALASVFSSVQFLPGATNIVLASDAPLSQNPALLAERYAARSILNRLVTPAYIRYLYGNDRFRQIAVFLATAGAEPNSDAKPVCYRYTAMMWLSKFFPSAGFLDPMEKLQRLPMPLLGLALATAAAIIIPARRSTRLRRCLLAGAAGFAGMLAETIAILHYQVKSGVLFQDIGLLLMSFMAGLSLGAFACDRISSRSGRGLERGWGVIFLAGLALMGGALAFVTQTGYSADIWGSGILLGCTGVLVSGLFSYSAKSKAGEEQTAVPLYSADLIGGVFGCLAASLVLIPGAGMTAASLMVIPAAILSAFLL